MKFLDLILSVLDISLGDFVFSYHLEEPLINRDICVCSIPCFDNVGFGLYSNVKGTHNSTVYEKCFFKDFQHFIYYTLNKFISCETDKLIDVT